MEDMGSVPAEATAVMVDTQGGLQRGKGTVTSAVTLSLLAKTDPASQLEKLLVGPGWSCGTGDPGGACLPCSLAGPVS